MSLRVGIIADDFTGGLMVAGYIEAAGIACPVLFDAADLDLVGDAPVVVLATRTRLIPPADAVAEVAGLADKLDRRGCQQIAYKVCASFDSTEDGNIGPVGDLLAQRYDQIPLLLSAGFPRFDATVHQGYLFYRSRLVSESIKRFDPITPMSDPDLVRFLSRQTAASVGLLPHGVLRQGRAASQARLDALVAEGKRFVLMDCSDDGDAEMGAQLAAGSRATIGSDAHIIALAIARGQGAGGAALPAARHAQGPAAVLVGSVGPVALAQIAAFEVAHPVLRLDLLDPRPTTAVIAEALDRATPLIGVQPFALTTATPQEGIARAQAALGPMEAARKAEGLLAGLAAGLVARGIRRLVVAGGETSGAVVAALGITRVRALPDGPLGTGFCVAETPLHLSLYLKPGKLGADDILLRAIGAMQA